MFSTLLICSSLSTSQISMYCILYLQSPTKGKKCSWKFQKYHLFKHDNPLGAYIYIHLFNVIQMLYYIHLISTLEVQDHQTNSPLGIVDYINLEHIIHIHRGTVSLTTTAVSSGIASSNTKSFKTSTSCQHWEACFYWLVVEPTHLKNMLVKLDHFPK